MDLTQNEKAVLKGFALFTLMHAIKWYCIISMNRRAREFVANLELDEN